MIDDRVSRYLHAQASSISLPPAGPAQAASRARQRRRHRRMGAAAGMALVLGAGVLVVTANGGRDEGAGVSSDGGTVVPSALDWSLVDPEGQGLSPRTAVVPAFTEDGAVYRLSTAPGVPGPGLFGPAELYRSVDGGVHWTSLGAPTDVYATAVGAEGGSVYVVGTAPAGGNADAEEYRFGRSDDGGATWSTTALGGELDDLTARYPGEVFPFPASVASHGDTVVATVSVSAHLDLQARTGLSPNDMEFTEDGVVAVLCEEGVTAATSEPGVVAAPQPGPCGGGDEVERSFTWEEMGVGDELRELVLDGRTYVYTSVDGGDFTVDELGPWWRSPAQVVATDDGFVLFRTDEGGGPGGITEVLVSADGSAWDSSPGLAGSARPGAGTIGGRPAVVLDDEHGNAWVHVQQPDGTWLGVDPRTAFGEDADGVVDVTIGPLGWAAVVSTPAGPQVVHSVDGVSISRVPLEETAAAAPAVTVSPMVTADAVVVTLTGPDDPDPARAAPQHVLVGTPRS